VDADLEEIHSLFECDPEKGLLFWKNRSRQRWRGTAGQLHTNGYWTVRVGKKRKRLLNHRIIFALVHGRWPNRIDHINMDRSDNRISNLREATRSQNAMNARKQRDNTSGFKGVSRWRGKWQAKIQRDGKQRFLGAFSTPQDAALAYKNAAINLHGEFARVS
jgi:hypothetical protein